MIMSSSRNKKRKLRGQNIEYAALGEEETRGRYTQLLSFQRASQQVSSRTKCLVQSIINQERIDDFSKQQNLKSIRHAARDSFYDELQEIPKDVPPHHVTTDTGPSGMEDETAGTIDEHYIFYDKLQEIPNDVPPHHVITDTRPSVMEDETAGTIDEHDTLYYELQEIPKDVSPHHVTTDTRPSVMEDETAGTIDEHDTFYYELQEILKEVPPHHVTTDTRPSVMEDETAGTLDEHGTLYDKLQEIPKDIRPHHVTTDTAPSGMEDETAGTSGIQGKRNIYKAKWQNSEIIPTVINIKNLVQYSDSSNDDFSADISDDDPIFLPLAVNNISDSSDGEPGQENPTKKKKLARWRTKNLESWKVNKVKEQRSKCLPYRNKSKECPAKTPKLADCSRCRFKCSTNFSQEDREEICRTYWNFNNYNRQKDFLIKNVTAILPRRQKKTQNSKPKSISKIFYLEGHLGRHRVCSNFFRKTLCISHGPVDTALQGVSSVGTFAKNDMRGKKVPGNKTTDQAIFKVRAHIENFPAVESHYVRQTSKKKYLESNLSILKMYELYKSSLDVNEKPVSEWKYRQIFCRDYNLSFFVPKKDQCSTCSKYQIADAENKRKMECDYSVHLIRKTECQDAKEKDKLLSQQDPTFIMASFDLQSVLQLPYCAVSQFYYSRKICVYNLTLYEGDGHNAYCFTWNELNGKRGSNEVGTILLKYIETLPSTVHTISLFSDTCGGQNRNQNVAAGLHHAVQTSAHINIIEQKFLESGHSYMECDSMHSAIESAKKHRSAFIMNDWLEIFRSARSKRGKNKTKEPYKVQELKFNNFLDLQSLAETKIKNKNINENGETVSWLKIKCLKFEKAYPDVIFYRYDHSSEYKKIYIFGRGRRSMTTSTMLKPAYVSQLPITAAKKKDLIKLCNQKLIPDELHSWYNNLPSSSTSSTSTATERLPEPNIDEDTGDDER